MDCFLFGAGNIRILSGAGNTAGSLFGIGNVDGFLVVIVKFAVAFPVSLINISIVWFNRSKPVISSPG